MEQSSILSIENIRTKVKVKNKDEAIQVAAEVLIENGYVTEDYLNSMRNREKIISTYIGNYVAIPHGESGSNQYIKKTGISLVILEEDIYFEENNQNKVKVLFGIASQSDEHLDILSKIAIYISDVKNVEKISKMTNPKEILEELNSINL